MKPAGAVNAVRSYNKKFLGTSSNVMRVLQVVVYVLMRIGIARILRITREVIKLVLRLAVRGLGRHAVGVIQSIGVGKLALGGSKCVINDINQDR